MPGSLPQGRQSRVKTHTQTHILREPTIERQTFTFYFKGIWRGECQSIPIDR
jgi:hypothetical protein